MKKYLLLYVTIVASNLLYAQAPAVKPPGFASPNAAALGKYGDIPVSYHTGVPEISIPIYTITEGSLSVPISLSYHSSGIKVDEVASNVGLGWSLNAGGMLTRTVNGGPDEGMTGSIIGSRSPYARSGWYKDYGFPSELTACRPRPLSIEGPVAGVNPNWGGCRQLFLEAAKGIIDTEPDLFTFNVNGVSGKFYFDRGRQMHMIPESDFNIEPINSPTWFYAWRIISPDGARYFFGGAAVERSCSDPGGQSGNKQTSTSTTWYLYRIESANGEDWINFTYSDDNYSFGNRVGHSVTFRGKDSRSPNMGVGNYGDLIGDYDDAPNELITNTVNGKFLSGITTSSGHTSVSFVQSTNLREDISFYDGGAIYSATSANTTSKSLKFININMGSLCKRFELSQDYFPSAVCTGCTGIWLGGFDQKRLRLNWVRESTCAGVEALPKYEFFYEPTLLPRRYSLARDVYGYYNGAESNRGLLPNFYNPVITNIYYSGGSSRTVNEAPSKAGILTKIKYPTGGSADFFYEAHREEDNAALVGGLRVKTIANSDGFGQITTKNFNYASGRVFFNPQSYAYQYPNNNFVFSGASLGGLDFGVQYVSALFPPLWSSHGYHIGYGEVKVSETGNGSTTYFFRNTTPSVINPSQYPLRPVVAVGSTSEQLKVEVKTEGNLLVSSTLSSSSGIGVSSSIQPLKVALVNCLNYSTLVDIEFGIFSEYSVDAYRYLPVLQTEIRDGLTQQTTLAYDVVPKHNSPRIIEMTDSKAAVHRTERIFASDPGSSAPVAMYAPSDPNFKNMLSSVIEQRSYVNGSITSKSTSQYTQRGTSILQTNSRVYPSGQTDFIETQYKYNDNLDLTNVVASNTGINKGYLWGYNNSLPIAEATNAENTKISVNSNAINNIFIPISGVSPQSISRTFVVDYTGSVVLKMGVTGSPAFTSYLDYSGALGNGTLTLTNGQSCGYNQVIFSNVSPGTYTISMTLRASSGGANVISCGQIDYPYTNFSSTGSQEFFYEGFEELAGMETQNPHTGKKYKLGSYYVPFTKPNGRNYIVEYWYLSGSIWVYATSPYTNGMTLSGGTAIDDVRVYPSDARMKTYTYDPGLGISSVLDENGRILYYNYDTLGRLSYIKNEQGGIEKQYSYNYKN